MGMSKVLGVKENVVIYKVAQNPVIFSEQKEECYFCNNNVPIKKQKKKQIFRQMTEEDIELVKKQCGGHSGVEMARFLNVGAATFSRRMRANNIVFFKHHGACHFCENGLKVKPTISTTLSNEMIEALKTQCGRHNFKCLSRLLNVT